MPQSKDISTPRSPLIYGDGARQCWIIALACRARKATGRAGWDQPRLAILALLSQRAGSLIQERVAAPLQSHPIRFPLHAGQLLYCDDLIHDRLGNTVRDFHLESNGLDKLVNPSRRL
jgi:hypothetical protein